ncbi:MAG: malto-oligosyltrehalose trehalohydrolase [Actinobacteria bacterium]|nr:malto-oligosyltrehalose trehalohydrolase [Actinomycetota bacterium]
MSGLGAQPLDGGGTSFTLWASKASAAEVAVVDGPTVAMDGPDGHGTFVARIEGVGPGARYRYRVTVEGEVLEIADPASRSQPEGVHGPSEVVDPSFDWTDDGWEGIPLDELVLYELHVGTFTEAGTFDAATERLDELAELGITAIEVMPIAQFPGGRNWGYDGVLPFAAQDTYGGPDGFRRFVDACHARGLAVVLDVVYNHFGPEGATQVEVAHYLTDRYETPWGPAINFDGPHSDHVRRYVVDNALWWTDHCHVDGLRLDAVHAILDQSAVHILEELASAVHARAERRGRTVHVIAESDLNDPRLVRPVAEGGLGLDGTWSDDFHHALHVTLTGEDDGYYADFSGVEDLAAALQDGFVFTGGYSRYRGHSHGRAPVGVPGERFVVCSQNHDQVGNRMVGDRMADLVPPGALRVAAAAVILGPFVPLLFMGEEYGETAPFQYFVSHTDEGLVEDVRTGRREEFSGFRWEGEVPDPQAVETFERSRLDHALKDKDPHAKLLAWYRELLRLRREVPAFASLDRDRITVTADGTGLSWHRWTEDGDHAVVVVHASDTDGEVLVHLPAGTWTRVLGDGSDHLDVDGHQRVLLPAWGVAILRSAGDGS